VNGIKPDAEAVDIKQIAAEMRAAEEARMAAMQQSDSVVPDSDAARLSSTGGRNTQPLTQTQIGEASDFARELGFDGPIDY
jgi:hypothetical protein